mgnify:CR=1 FL=1
MTYIPKGSMCASCKNKNNDCSGLNFSKMQVIKQYDQNHIGVKCVNFKKDS